MFWLNEEDLTKEILFSGKVKKAAEPDLSTRKRDELCSNFRASWTGERGRNG